ncbi:hypothetical protein N7478_008421 [Penicillium angulare]|uniref:uncharacterized protein n=1 Tax=Penicillium angulare TaxID=116970 RepID=UPI00254180AE|nr:uncharacterized protein N7478_008421 [Penicillium angulare]KAJ5273296.1 hypothetical protein N7478_008421 [Penicillium angulare]
MLTLSHLPNKSRRGFQVFRILVILFAVGYYCKETIWGLEHHYSTTGPQDGSSFHKRLDQIYLAPEDSHRPMNLKTGLSIAIEPENASCESFRRSFDNLLSLLPDNSHIEDITGTIKGTGEEKLREVGFRARAFKALLEAWEAVHFVQTGEQMLVRNDILQLLRDNPGIAEDLKLDQIDMIHAFEQVQYFLTQLSRCLFSWTTPYFPDHMTLHAQFWNAGRGIVFTAGNRQAPYVLTSIQSIRGLGCELPIEVLYLGNDDLGEDFREELESIPGVITRDLNPMVSDEGWKLRGWAAKPFAILLSSFREAIFIDADSIFLRNPEELFLDRFYQKTGALFFKDRLFMPGSKKEWLRNILPSPISKQARKSRLWTGESIHMQESGVVVVDKWRHFVALLMVTRMNGPDRDGKKPEGRVGVYDMVFGDKETFWLGWELVGDTDYAFHKGDAAVMGKVEMNPKYDSPITNGAKGDQDLRFTICAPQLLHLGVDGHPLWFNGWILPNKFARGDHLQPAQFDAFIREPGDAGTIGSWRLEKNNVCCLSANHVVNFTYAEKESLGNTIQIAKDVSAI